MLLVCSTLGSIFHSSPLTPLTSNSGICCGSFIITEYVMTMGLCRLLNFLIPNLQSLSDLGDFQLAALVMLTWSSSSEMSFHSIQLICSSSPWSLIHWTSSLCFSSCSSMFYQNVFTSAMSNGFSIWIVFFPGSLQNILASFLNILFCMYCLHLLICFKLLCLGLQYLLEIFLLINLLMLPCTSSLSS